MLQQGREAWKAFCAPNPLSLDMVMKTNSVALPFLARALQRHREEFPAVDDGLSRTERQLLEVVASGIQQPAEIFHAITAKKENAFLGDTTVWRHLLQLCLGEKPLLQRVDGEIFFLPGKEEAAFLEQVIRLTQNGQAVLSGQADWIVLNGRVDHWLGGVQLQGEDAVWRWDKRAYAIVQR